MLAPSDNIIKWFLGINSGKGVIINLNLINDEEIDMVRIAVDKYYTKLFLAGYY
ncbi:MAG: hypothetical protein KJ718_01130 [Nanoarchaeota archaeon]|nr:hypothetical protein [Nanoarchaeota archaeon]MBU1051136.1 hypothetical protein [Nanoarchaeota archaeon]MBU1988532.1 hypothetical protein [Nanoarchaeota archaeon]